MGCPYLLALIFSRCLFYSAKISCFLWHVAPRLKHIYITFSRTRGQCNSVLWVFALRSFISLLQTRLLNLEGDHVNSITGTTLRHTDMKLAPHHPCIGLLCSIALVRINALIYLERKTTSQVSPMPFLKWHLAAGILHLWEERMRRIAVTLVGFILWLANRAQ